MRLPALTGAITPISQRSCRPSNRVDLNPW
jgi:hypothetical protein